MGSKTFEKHAGKIRNKDMSFENPSTETDFFFYCCGQNGDIQNIHLLHSIIQNLYVIIILEIVIKPFGGSLIQIWFCVMNNDIFVKSLEICNHISYSFSFTQFGAWHVTEIKFKMVYNY